jgi:hypothetical protein
LRRCLSEPIPEIFVAAQRMSEAADAHLVGEFAEAEKLFALANDPMVWSFTDRAWGVGSKARHSFIPIPDPPPYLSRLNRPHPRMPTSQTERAVVARDGHHCRFCGMPVVSSAIRRMMTAAYPEAVPWGSTNATQHAGFQCMWLQFDHVLPNSRGGTSDLDNIVVACAPCNFGRMEYTLAEAQIVDPLRSQCAPFWAGAARWDGLERLRLGTTG